MDILALAVIVGASAQSAASALLPSPRVLEAPQDRSLPHGKFQYSTLTSQLAM